MSRRTGVEGRVGVDHARPGVAHLPAAGAREGREGERRKRQTRRGGRMEAGRQPGVARLGRITLGTELLRIGEGRERAAAYWRRKRERGKWEEGGEREGRGAKEGGWWRGVDGDKARMMEGGRQAAPSTSTPLSSSISTSDLRDVTPFLPSPFPPSQSLGNMGVLIDAPTGWGRLCRTRCPGPPAPAARRTPAAARPGTAPEIIQSAHRHRHRHGHGQGHGHARTHARTHARARAHTRTHAH